MRGMWGRLFISPFTERFARFKWWAVRVTEPWREEQTSLDLEWRLFAQKHNAAGKRPMCMYEGMEKDLNPNEKVELYEFPLGHDSKDQPLDPDLLVEALDHDRTQHENMIRKAAGLENEE